MSSLTRGSKEIWEPLVWTRSLLFTICPGIPWPSVCFFLVHPLVEVLFFPNPNWLASIYRQKRQTCCWTRAQNGKCQSVEFDIGYRQGPLIIRDQVTGPFEIFPLLQSELNFIGENPVTQYGDCCKIPTITKWAGNEYEHNMKLSVVALAWHCDVP